MRYRENFLIIAIALVITSCNKNSDLKTDDSSDSRAHPSLILTKKGVKTMRANLGSTPIFDKTLATAKRKLMLK